jgi:hypothetical protein
MLEINYTFAYELLYYNAAYATNTGDKSESFRLDRLLLYLFCKSRNALSDDE